jgi:hypothetical protein
MKTDIDYKKVSDALKRYGKEAGVPLKDVDWGEVEAPELDLENDKD